MLRQITLLISINFILIHARNTKDHDTNGMEIFLNEIHGNGKKTYAIYGQFDKCEGYFSRIQWDVIDQKFEWKCDSVWRHTVDITVNAYRESVRHSIDVKSKEMVKDSNGHESYNSMGRVMSGMCQGDELIVQANLRVTKGRCREAGVTELYSRKHSALIAVKGVCQTTCYGTVWAHYWPGKQ